MRALEARFFQLRRGEEGAARRILGVFFLTSMAACLALSGGESLFLKAWDSKAIPFAFFGTALITLGLSPLLGSLVGRLGAGRMSFGLETLLFSAFGVLALLLFRGWTGPVAGAIAFGLGYLSLAVLRTLALSLAESVLDVRQMKRIFPAIAAGGTFGFVVGGFGTPLLLAAFGGTRGLLAFVAVLIFLALALTSWSFRVDVKKQPPRAADAEIPVESASSKSLSLLVALLVASTAFLVIHFDFLYLFAAKATWKNPDELTKVFGTVRGVSTGVTFLLQIFVLPRLLKRFGPSRLLSLFPGFTAISFGIVGFSFTMTHLLFGRVGYYLTKEAFFFPALQTVWAALPVEIRKKRTFAIFSGMNALGSALGAGMLVVFVTGGILSPKQSAWISVGLALVALVAALAVGRVYLKTLLDGIAGKGEKNVDLLAAYSSVANQGSRSFLLALLEHPDPATVKFALAFLRRDRAPETDAAVIRRLAGEKRPEVLPAILDYYDGKPDPALWNHAAAFASSDGATISFIELCAAASETNEGAKKALADLKAAAAKTSPLIVRVIETAEGSPATELPIHSLERIGEMFDLAERAKVARKAFLPVLRGELLAASGAFRNPENLVRLARIVLFHGSDEEKRDLLGKAATDFELLAAAGKAIQDGKEEDSLALAALLRDHASLDELTRITLIASLPRIDAPSVVLLREKLLDRWGGLRLRARIAQRLREEALETGAPDSAFDETLLGETRAARRDVLRTSDTGTFPEMADLLRPELERRLALRIQMLSDLVVLRQPDRSTAVAAKGLSETQSAARTASLEALETILPRKISELLLPVLERDDEKIRQEDAAPSDEAVRRADLADTFARSDSPWERALGYELCRRAGKPAPDADAPPHLTPAASAFLTSLRGAVPAPP